MIKKYNEAPAKIRALMSGFRPVFYYQSFDDYRKKLGFNVPEIASLTCKSTVTVRLNIRL